MKNPFLHSAPRLGRVKFFDATKRFGFITQLDESADYYVNQVNIVSSLIIETEVVVFNTIPSRHKPNEEEAANVSNRIPVYVFDKTSSQRSYALPLLPGYIDQEMLLTENLDPGFYIVKAQDRDSSKGWKVAILDTYHLENGQLQDFIRYTVSRVITQVLQYQLLIESLLALAEAQLPKADWDGLRNDLITVLEGESLLLIHTVVTTINKMPALAPLIEAKKRSLNPISFVLWSQGALEKLPTPVSQEEANIWHFQILPALGWKVLQQVILKLLQEVGAAKQVAISYHYLISGGGWTIATEEEEEQIIAFLKVIKPLFTDLQPAESNFQSDNPAFYIRLLREGLIPSLSDERLIQYITHIAVDEEKAAFIEEQPADKILVLYKVFPQLAYYQDRYLADLLEQRLERIPFLCFDLESNTEEIHQFAWKTNAIKKTNADFALEREGWALFSEHLQAASLVVGHNIKAFDLPILQKREIVIFEDLVWDTLEVEMLLQPRRFSYGLKTLHTAEDDVAFTYKLFKNQLARIVMLAQQGEDILTLLPTGITQYIRQVHKEATLSFEDPAYFNKQANEYFRHEPARYAMPIATSEYIREKLSGTERKIVIAPECLWNSLSSYFNLRFYGSNSFFNWLLQKEKIEAAPTLTPWQKAVLCRFIENCINDNQLPYWHRLPTAIVMKLGKHAEVDCCVRITPDWHDSNTAICISTAETQLLPQLVEETDHIHVIVVGHELHQLTSKIPLQEKINFLNLFNALKNQPVWLQLSGGKRVIGLNKTYCKLLGIDVFPTFMQKTWLEKVGKGIFTIWCNINIKAMLESLPLESAAYIPWVEENMVKSNAFVVWPDHKRTGYVAEQKRVNSESLYRRLYWTYQLKLLESIRKSSNPQVLLVNDIAEVTPLSAYARRRGYFIPDTNASLARQLELLHIHKAPRKLLIIPFAIWDKVIAANYIGALDYIWDSFLLLEKQQMMANELNSGVLSEEDGREDDWLVGEEALPQESNLYAIIKMHQPLINYYYNLIIDLHPDSHLFFIDSRLTDYYGIEKSLLVNATTAIMWQNEKEYEADKEMAGTFFSDEHKNAATEFDIEEAKEILRHIFLAREEGEEPFPWHDYQHPCLNNILPAQKDLLISLPTGAGKSLLFQAPALFRSTFSCKLSIVISPLRALMEDQVEALWSKGFYGNVEYLSGDKSQIEIRDIYRRIAGGEIALLFITPERFRAKAFEKCLLTRLEADGGLEYVVFDEAHCISQWGQEFRPDYLNAGKKASEYTSHFSLRKLLFSATISEQVFAEIQTLMPGIETIESTDKSYNPVRDHIRMDFKHNIVVDEQLVEIATYLKNGKFNPSLSRAIVFVKSRRKVEECALIMPDVLKEVFGASCNFLERVGAFHARMDAEDRKETYEKFKSGDLVVLFATKAFGMGMDIPNIHFVAHYSPPGTFEDFLQEVGRAGRNEQQRNLAGFNGQENPIKTLCLINQQDFAKLKEQLHESRISWHELKDVKTALEEYITKFNPSIATDTVVAVPFNLYSVGKASLDEALDIKFRIALYWLEKLERIKLGYFTVTHIDIAGDTLLHLKERINDHSDEKIKKVGNAILLLQNKIDADSQVVQLSVTSLRSLSKMSLESLFGTLLRMHAEGIIRILQDTIILPVLHRQEEINISFKKQDNDKEKYPALRIVFALAKKILRSTPFGEEKTFDGEELDTFCKELIQEYNDWQCLPWSKTTDEEKQIKSLQQYFSDIIRKRSKHAFTIIRLLGKIKHTTKMDKVMDANRKVKVRQSVFNGYHKKEEWQIKITQLEEDCIKLLDYIAKHSFESNQKAFNWADLVQKLKLKDSMQHLSDMLFILSVLGYTRMGGLIPSGVEIQLLSTANIRETETQSSDQLVFEEFEQAKKVRELKLIALEVLSNFNRGDKQDEAIIKQKQDTFIKGYFECDSLESLLELLQEELPPNDPLLVKWRGDAIQKEEERLNEEQRKVYHAEVKQHINVMAGPGSGKTHTLTLRVARLVHHIGVKPEEILVLAYNRAVVSELKTRLGKLFQELGYGNLAKRIKIFTFHGLAKKYCKEQLDDRPFGEWEKILLEQLRTAPGQMMAQLSPLQYILVDEFQDITQMRIELLEKLYQLTLAYLFIIGDPNQSIYGYERKNENGSLSPWPYYDTFNTIFSPAHFQLYNNHRSYPDILRLAGEVLTLPPEHQHLIPKPTLTPDPHFITAYTQIIDTTEQKTSWWSQIATLLDERVAGKSYRQIAILFRTNNEVYRGFQKVKELNLNGIRIRIQGSLPYEFNRIRECFAVIHYLKMNSGLPIPRNFPKSFSSFVHILIEENPNWNHFYVRVMHALVLEYVEEQDDNQTFDQLIAFIAELTHRGDDGQLYKIYEKHAKDVSGGVTDTEIVLTTMHKVKGLEFDAVIIPPSFSNLPLLAKETDKSEDLVEELDEERRLIFVAYTRAKYRLLIFKYHREIALVNGRKYIFPKDDSIRLGIPVEPEIKKLNIGWAASDYVFNSGINSYIKESIKSGDFVYIKRKHVPNNGNSFTVYEIFKEGSGKAIGQLSRTAGAILQHEVCKGFVVNEVVVWSYEDTLKFDKENPPRNSREKPFASYWSEAAKQHGYIYLVDFAGFGTPGENGKTA